MTGPVLMQDPAPKVSTTGQVISPGGLDLRGFALFTGMPEQVPMDFGAAGAWRRYAIDEMIFDQHSDTLEVHFVVRGKVKLLTNAPGGQSVPLAEVKAGEVFGELAAIDRLPRSARAIASADSVLASIAGPMFLDLMVTHPQVAVRMCQRLASIIRSMDVRLANMSQLDPSQRVIAELMRRAEPDPRVPGSWIIPFAPTHGDIASWAGVDKEVAAVAIGELARDGILRRRGGSIVFLDWAGIQALVKPRSARGSSQPAEPAAEMAQAKPQAAEAS